MSSVPSVVNQSPVIPALAATLLAQTAPRDLTPKDAMARGMFYKPGEMLATSGLGSLSRHLLPRGDAEVRYWGGFAWSTDVYILRRRAGTWSAAHLVAWSRKPPVPLPAPKLGWPAFWMKAERLGIYTLPDQENAGSKKGLLGIDDGYSTLVEFQRDGVYRAYAYDNPTNQTSWPPAKPMAALVRFLAEQFPR